MTCHLCGREIEGSPYRHTVRNERTGAALHVEIYCPSCWEVFLVRRGRDLLDDKDAEVRGHHAPGCSCYNCRMVGDPHCTIERWADAQRKAP